MRVLLIKTSSMGDVLHTLPALTDAAQFFQSQQKNFIVDWVVEESFQEIPSWHPNVDQVIPVALRRWRKDIFSASTRAECREFYQQLRHYSYDLILDAQGLLKSALLTFFAKGLRAGLDFSSAREHFSSFAYQKKFAVNFHQHAVLRMRQLFSLAFGYDVLQSPPDFGLDLSTLTGSSEQKKCEEKYIVLLHGTTWDSKQWPEYYWRELALLAGDAGYRVKISGGNAEEVARAERIADQLTHVDVTPYLSIFQMATLLANAHAAIAVDTGFGHLASALHIPTISLYGATNPHFTGALGKASVHLTASFPCAPCLKRTCTYKEPSAVTPACFAAMTPSRVWNELQLLAR